MQHRSSKKYEHLMHVSELFDGHCHQQGAEDRASLSCDEVKVHLKNWALIGSALRGELPAKFDPNFADKVMARLEHEHMDSAPVAEDESFGVGAAADNMAAQPELSWVPPSGSAASHLDEELPSLLQKRHAFRDMERIRMQVANAPEVKLGAAAASTVEPAAELKTAQAESMNWLHLFSFKRVAMFASQVAIAASVAVVAIVGLQTYNASDPVLGEPAGAVANNVGPVSGLSLASYQNSDNEVLMNLKQMPEPNLEGQEAYQSDLERKQQEELERINLYVQGYVLDTAANR